MSASIVVMLLWVGGASGGPVALPIFHTAAACEAARPEVERFYRGADRPGLLTRPVASECRGFPVR